MSTTHAPRGPQPDQPSLAEQARAGVANARVAALTTYPRTAPCRRHTTNVVIDADADGRPIICLEPGAPAVHHLQVRALATVHVAPSGSAAISVHGAATRLADTDGRGLLRYRVEVGAVRVGDSEQQLVPTRHYLAADPDLIAAQAPLVLRHLAKHHPGEMAACLRARGMQLSFAEPVALDSGGLDVAAVSSTGVDVVRLAFPSPVRHLRDLGPGLATALLCRCQRGSAADPGRAS